MAIFSKVYGSSLRTVSLVPDEGEELKYMDNQGWIFLFVGSLFGGLGVILGAFGAHALKARLAPELLATFETGVRYQIYHALALLAVALLYACRPAKGLLTATGWLFVAGTLLFSGSLYVLVLGGIRWVGAITPVGGTALIIGWFCLAAAGLWSREEDKRRVRPEPPSVQSTSNSARMGV